MWIRRIGCVFVELNVDSSNWMWIRRIGCGFVELNVEFRNHRLVRRRSHSVLHKKMLFIA